MAAFSKERVRAVRSRLGVTQIELAALFGATTYHWVQNRERGRVQVQGLELQVWEALEELLLRMTPIKVWGPPSLASRERLTRIMVLSCGSLKELQDLARP